MNLGQGACPCGTSPDPGIRPEGGCNCLDDPAPQRQDSLDDQLRSVAAAATRMGCYDAADWIKARTL